MPNNSAPAIILSTDDTTAVAVSRSIRDAVRIATTGHGHYVAYVTAHSVTTENVAAHAKALASFTFPHLADSPTTELVDGKRTRTRFGHAINAASVGLKRALTTDEETTAAEPGVIRISLSGEGGTTVTFREGDEGYAAALALVAASAN